LLAKSAKKRAWCSEVRISSVISHPATTTSDSTADANRNLKPKQNDNHLLRVIIILYPVDRPRAARR
jgi:hypothetical protein